MKKGLRRRTHAAVESPGWQSYGRLGVRALRRLRPLQIFGPVAEADRVRLAQTTDRAMHCMVGHAVTIEPGLRPQSPKNGSFSNSRRRLSAISLRECLKLEPGDRWLIRESPPLAGLSRGIRDIFSQRRTAWLGREDSNSRIPDRTRSLFALLLISEYGPAGPRGCIALGSQRSSRSVWEVQAPGRYPGECASTLEKNVASKEPLFSQNVLGDGNIADFLFEERRSPS